MQSESSTKKIQVVIENRLYDLTKFGKIHPGGHLILENFNNCDTTDYFYALHSESARKMLKNMPSTEVPDADKVPQSDYLKLTYKLEKEGYFKSDFRVEFIQLFHCLGFFVLTFCLAEKYPALATILLAVGTLISSWIGHMWEHSRDNFLGKLSSYFTPIIAGISGTWWSTKHNRHHLSTNETEHDSDIQLFPFIYLWTPKKQDDAWNRGIQHMYFSALYSILDIKWQVDSLVWAVQKRHHKELGFLLLHWTWKLLLPWKIWVAAVLITGTIMAWVVTASHQAEQKISDKREFLPRGANSKYQIHDYVAHQVMTTRNIDIHSWFLNYICGGMQHQIEHHIFPRMPLYKLPTIKPLVKKYCDEHGLEFREEGFLDIMKRNYENIETFAKVKAQ